MALKKLFTPYQIGTVKIPNRLVVPAIIVRLKVKLLSVI